MIRKVVNTSSKVIYYNTITNKTLKNIYDLIDIELIRNSDLKSHEKNISNYFIRPDNYCNVIKGLYPIPPKSAWVFNDKLITNDKSDEIKYDYCLDKTTFFTSLERQIKIIGDKKIGVELSGGLDTAIIIGLLKHFNIFPFLVGSFSNKYEFRTESIIQRNLTNNYSCYSFLDKNNTQPFTELKNTPLHQLPSSTSLYHYFANSIANEFKKNGTEIVLSGMGLDLLFCENPNYEQQKTMTSPWQTWMLDDNWFNEYIYNEKGIIYKSGAASSIIIKSICSLRRHEKEDSQKKWARDFFKEYLPEELTKYYYKADNSGEFLEGLWNAKKDIVDLYKLTYDITKFNEFNSNSLELMFENLQICNESKDKQILAHISFANWVNSLVTNSIIKV
jgi:hypothetical protein